MKFAAGLFRRTTGAVSGPAFLSRFLLSCLLLAGAFPAPAQITTTGRQPTTFQSPPHIEGRVVARGNNSPLKGVAVTVRQRQGAEVGRSYTNDSGEFGFYNLAEGSFLLTASHPDYEEYSQEVDLFGRSVPGLRIVLSRKKGVRPVSSIPTVPLWALKISPKAQRQYSKGLKELQKGNGKKSIAHLQAAIRLYPQYASAYSALGTVHLKLGDQEAAMAVFERALEIDENLPDACFGLGVLYNAQKRFGDAVRYLLRARMLRSQDWHVHYELGQAYGAVADWPKAEASLRRARELHSDFPRTHLLLINALALQDKYDATLAAMENYLRLFPRDSFTPQVRQKRDLLQAELEKKPLPPEPEKP